MGGGGRSEGGWGEGQPGTRISLTFQGDGAESIRPAYYTPKYPLSCTCLIARWGRKSIQLEIHVRRMLYVLEWRKKEEKRGK